MKAERKEFSREDFTVALAREHFGYDDTLGRVIRLTNPKRGPRSAGKIASSLHRASGFRQVVFHEVVVYEHHLVWALVHGNWPTGNIRHRDEDKQNNRVANLYDASNVNVCNDSTTASEFLPGVIPTKNGKFKASIYRGKPWHLGTFSTQQEAHEAYQRAKVVLHNPLNRKIRTEELLKPLLKNQK